MIGDQATLTAKTAIVTGGASGIGAATAVMLRDLGARVFAVDRVYGPGAGQDASGLETVGCDLGDVAAIKAMAATVGDLVDGVDILVNCAGIVGPKAGILDTREADWDLVLDVNLRSVVFVSQAVVPLLTRNGRRDGRIVNVSSAAAHRSAGHSIAYSASKAGIESVTRLLAGELAAHGIAVNAVAPGVTATAIFGDDSDEARARRASSGTTANLFGRFSLPEDIASTITFLCVPASRQITGQVVHVSAGAIV